MKNPENSWSDILSPPAQERLFLRKDRLNLFQIPQLELTMKTAGSTTAPLLTLLVVAYASSLLAVELQPGTYTPQPAGTRILDLTYAHLERDALYSKGKKLPLDPLLILDLVQVRGRYHLPVEGSAISASFSFYCGNNRGARALTSWGSQSGCSDLLLGMTYWPLHDLKKGQFLGLTPYISLPTGEYDPSRPYNFGENRYSFGLNSGYAFPFSPRFSCELLGDIQLFGENDDYLSGHSLKQQPLLTLQYHLRYQLTPSGKLFASYLHDWASATSIDGKAQHNGRNNGRYRIGYQQMVTKAWQLQLSWGADLQVANGLRESERLLLRSVWLF